MILRAVVNKDQLELNLLLFFHLIHLTYHRLVVNRNCFLFVVAWYDNTDCLHFFPPGDYILSQNPSADPSCCNPASVSFLCKSGFYGCFSRCRILACLRETQDDFKQIAVCRKLHAAAHVGRVA